jgi:GT2 family glycosyltransferase/glycosyltransferase involved in cell wall biosynthesis
MNRFWDPVIEPVLRAAKPRVIVEIGAEAGATTTHLLAYAAEVGAVVHVIEPVPRFDPTQFELDYGEHFVMHRALSLNALPRIEAPDVVLIDGDHNWYTVYHELESLQKLADAARKPLPVVILHDTGWPYARRDLYYDPGTIPVAFRQPHRRAGIVPGSAELVESGGLNAHLENASYEGTPRNGVLTALEDFVDASPHKFEVASLPGLNGLSVVVDARRAPARSALSTSIKRLRSKAFLEEWLATLEEHRVQAQIRLAAARHGADAASGRAAELESERARLETEIAKLETEVERLARERRAAIDERDRVEAQRKELRDELASERKELAEAGKQLAEAGKELTGTRDELTVTRGELTEARGELTEARKDRTKLEADVERLAKERRAAIEERDRAEAERKEIKGELGQSRPERAKTAAELERAELRAAAAQRDLNAIERDLAVAGDELAAARGDLDRTRTDAEWTRADLERTQVDLERTQVDLERTQADLAAAHAETAARADELAAAREDFRRSLAALEEVRATLTAELEAVRTTAAAAAAERDRLTHELGSARADAHQLVSDLAEVRATLRQSQRNARELESERDSLTMRLADAVETERLLARERRVRAEISAALAQAHREADEAERAAAALADSLAAHHRAAAAAAERERKAQLERDEERLASEAERRNAARSARRADALTRELAEVRAELDAARRELDDLRRAQAAAASAASEPAPVGIPVVLAHDDAGELRARVAARDGELARLAAEREELILRLADREKVLRGSARQQIGSPAVASDDSASVDVEFRRQFASRYAEVVAFDPEWSRREDLDGPLPVDVAGVLADADHSTEQGTPSVDVVVCIHNALDDVRNCLWSLVAKGTRPFHLILVNDGSDEETTEYLRRFRRRHPHVELLENFDEPHGYTIAANLGLRAARGDYVALLNSDTVVTPGWLEAIVRLGESDDQLGLIGPLSNAASHQSVPRKRDEAGWAVNQLPEWIGPDDVAYLVRSSPIAHVRPRLPFLNGFCYVIKRAVIDRIGYFDEETFARGYSEENDYSLRAAEAGFEVGIADDAYVFHAKSRSYGGAAGRKPIADRHYQLLLEKHGAENVAARVKETEASQALEPLRGWLADALDDPAGLAAAVDGLTASPLAVCFVLPGMSRGSAGGVHSVYQEAKGMRALGIPARVALGASSWDNALEAYADAEELFVPFADDRELEDVTRSADVVVATHFTSVPQVAQATSGREDVLTAYYVQDYEPFFAPAESAAADAALLSYAHLAEPFLFAKTHWLCNIVARLHGLPVAKVQPSLDRDVYSAHGRSDDDVLRVVAMVRPRTPRRQPATTIRVLARLAVEFGEHVRITTFGCSDDEVAVVLDGAPPPGEHLSLLTREQVATLFRRSDVFLDMSIYQAFGRTGLEAMACGCTAVMPVVGGVHEFAVHEHNSLLVDTLGDEPAFDALARLAVDRDLAAALKAQGLATAQRYSVLGASLSEYIAFANARQLRSGAFAGASGAREHG